MKTVLTALAALTLGTGSALAQYYAPPPPPPPGYGPPPGYYAPPPRPYYREIGRHCRVFLPTGYGRGERYVCRIVDPKPVGEECACPAPPPGPGYPPGPYIDGRTIP